MPICKGSAILIPTGNEHHLFFVLNDPAAQPPHQVLLVNITTLRNLPSEDTTCILKAGDHPFITRDSYIAYSKCRIESRDALNRHLESGLFMEREQASTEVIEAIINGLHTSKRVKPYVKNFWSELS